MSLFGLYNSNPDDARRTVPPIKRGNPLSIPSPAEWARRILGIIPGPDQIPVLNESALRVILCCTRRWGKTFVTSVAALHHAIFHPGAAVVIVARNLKQAARHINNMQRFLRGPLKMKFSRLDNDPHSLLLPNESTVECLPASDAARSANATFLIIDEAALLPDDVLEIFRPMLATNEGARIWLLSTPNGQSGFFYEHFHDQRLDYARYRITAGQCPRLVPSFLEEERLTLSPHRFAQEYNCEFLPAETQLLARDLIDDLLCDPIPARVLPSQAPATRSVHYLGLDLGKRRDKPAIVHLEERTEALGHLDLVTYSYPTDTRLILRGIRPLDDAKTYPEILKKVHQYIEKLPKHANIHLTVDASGLGDPVVDFIHIANLPAKIHPVIITSGEAIGRLPHGATVPKNALLENLRINVQRQSFLIENHLAHLESLIRELLRLGDPKHPHTGDIAMALALALFQSRPHPTIGERNTPLPGTPGIR